jgi:ankyrin repeat protein
MPLIEKWTPLHVASQFGHLDVVKWLLDHNADVHVHDDKGDTPLHLAAIEGHLEVARILLEHNAEVNSRNNDGSTPLLLRHIVDTLMLYGYCWTTMRMCTSTTTKETLHYITQRQGHLEVARILLERNAEVNSRNNDGYTPLLLCING